MCDSTTLQIAGTLSVDRIYQNKLGAIWRVPPDIGVGTTWLVGHQLTSRKLKY
jgi:hypothetical protein